MKKHRNNKYRIIAIAFLLIVLLFFVKKLHSGGVDMIRKDGIKGLAPVLFLPVSGVLFFFGEAIEDTENRKKRKEELKKEYPEFALKVSMLIRAGFTPRGAMEKIGKNYLSRRENGGAKEEALYEEILFFLREIGGGVPETEAYEHFESRCGIFEITRFTGLLIRGVKRGGTSLGEELKEESRRAREAQKEIVKKKGEAAGTKLMLPMMIFLLIVMIIILYPAFTVFSQF